MKILMIINYYYPYISGLSEYVRRISERLVERGNEVSVLTARHDKSLKKRETINGVDVIRCGYLFKIGKGMVMPSFIRKGYKLSKRYDAVNIHMPLLEAGIFLKLIKNAIITYHCDLNLDNKMASRIIEKVYYISAGYALRKAKKIVTYTEDYAKHSWLLKHHWRRCRYVYPPIDEDHFNKCDAKSLIYKHDLKGRRIIGFSGRFVYEKGLTYLLKSIPYVLKEYPNAVFLLAGEYKNVAGGSNIAELKGLIDEFREKVILLGNVGYEDLPEFYSACDILVLPSIDSLEAFGIVQIESMYCGTPVIATDLPGVRVPVQKTGMGIVIRKRSERDIAKAVIKILRNKEKYVKGKAEIEKEFSMSKTIAFYEELFNEQ